MTPSGTATPRTAVGTTHHVRLAMATCVVAAVTAVLGFQLFASHLGQTSRDVVREASCQEAGCTDSAGVRRAVAVLEDQGLACRTKPGLTDQVVFEWRTTEVSVVDFATALKASSNGEGWVRRYCMPS